MNPEPYRYSRLFPLSFVCHRRLKLSLRPITISFACSRPFRCVATPPLISLSFCLAPLLSLWDCEPASDLKNFHLNSHSVELPPALQYVSELCNKPDGLVKDAVRFLADYIRIIITIFVHCFPRVSDEHYSQLYDSHHPAATIDYQIGTPPVQQRFLSHDFTPTFCGPHALTLHPFLPRAFAF